MAKSLLSVWMSPWMILAAVIAGATFGKTMPEATGFLALPGNLYIALMQMTVLPIMCTAIISSIGGALSEGNSRRLLIRSLTVFLTLLVMVVVLGLAIGLILQPGSGLSTEARRALGAAIINADGAAQQNSGLASLLTGMVSPNIVQSASQGEMLALMFFSIIIGMALGRLENNQGRAAIGFCESLFAGLCKIIDWVMHVLPIGVFSLVATNVAGMSAEVLGSVAKLVGAFYLGLFGNIVVLLVACALWCRRGPLAVLMACREPLLIGVATESDYAPMPSAIAAAQRLGAPQQTAEIVVPIGANLFNMAYILYYIVAVLFAAQLYDKPVGVEEILVIVIGSILITMAGAELPMLSVAMIPLGLPVEAMIVILTAIGPLVNGSFVAVDYLGSITATLLVSATESESPQSAIPALEPTQS